MQEKRFCPKCNKKEYKSECAYGPDCWEKYAKIISLKESHKNISTGKEVDKEGYMAKSELDRIEKAAKELKSVIKSPDMQLPAWVQSKITKAVDYLDTAADYMHSDSDNIDESKNGLWKNIHKKRKRGERPARPGEKGYPKTLDIEEEKKSKNPCWKGYKRTPGTKKYEPGSCVKEEDDNIPELRSKTITDSPSNTGSEKGKKVSGGQLLRNLNKDNDSLNKKKKKKKKSVSESSFEIAHTSDDAKKSRRLKKIAKLAQHGTGGEQMNAAKKSGVSLFPVKKEELSLVDKILHEISSGEFDTIDYICPYCGCDPCECEGNEVFVEDDVNEAVRLQAKNGNLVMVVVDWKGKTYALKMFFPQTSIPTRKDVMDQIQKVYPGSKLRHYSISDKQPGEPFLQIEDWQKINTKDNVDGLSQKAVNAYRKENPGSKLQTAVTETNPTGERKNRRTKFCKRMSGMKKKLTSQKTASDPDSNINKALRRWKCR